MPAVELRDVTKTFDKDVTAVAGLNLSVSTGEFVVLLGPSGCGKSTVLRIVAGLEEPTSGDLLIDGRSALHLSPRERLVAMVFQNFALYPHLRVGANIGFPLRIAGVDAASADDRAAQMAAALGIGDLLDRDPARLSGGQRQRVAMGRALVRRPRLLLMDEPLSNLDMGLRASLRAEIIDLTRQLGMTTLYVTHDQTEALTMADRIAVLRDGVLQDVGTPADIHDRPATAHVAAFVGTPRMNLVEAVVDVQLDRYVALHLGRQELRLPWGDLTGRAVARYHSERIMVGLRPEALSPTDRPEDGTALRGRVRTVEHHGHESLVYLTIGAEAIDLDEPVPADPEPAPRRFGRLRRARPGPSPVGRHHRPPAELTVRTAPYLRCRPGEPMTVRVRTEALHFFDRAGTRIRPTAER